MINKGLFTSNTDEWETPQDLFDSLHSEFSFNLDVCATLQNAKLSSFFTREEDALKKEWEGVCWMNPPYGRQIRIWVQKAYESSLKGTTVVCLLPARTDTGWWHDYCVKGEVRFIRGRLKFGNAKWNAPFPSAIVIFKPAPGSQQNISSKNDL